MAKAQIPSVSECVKSLRSGMLQPFYFICGDDSYLIDRTVADISKSAERFIFSDFDKVVYRGGDEKNLADILTSASAFPFSSEKKLVIIKEFEKFRDKKYLASFIASPPDFAVMIVTQNGQVSSAASEPYKSLLQKGMIYEAKELKGKHLVQWVMDHVKEQDKIISPENAQMLVEITGDSRTVIEDQIGKIITFLGDRREITHREITDLAARTKEYTIFDLQNAVGRRHHSDAFRYALNLIDKGKEPVFIIFMLTRYFTALSRIGELSQLNTPGAAAARELGITEWVYRDYLSARKNFSEPQLEKIAAALLKADITLKTSSIDEKTVISVLLGEILSA